MKRGYIFQARTSGQSRHSGTNHGHMRQRRKRSRTLPEMGRRLPSHIQHYTGRLNQSAYSIVTRACSIRQKTL